MKKSLIFWFAAATCAAWILVGCEQEAKTEYVTQKEMIHLDVGAADEAELKGYLVDDGKALSIGLTGEVTLTNSLFVPDGKVVYILPAASLGVDTFDLTVDGIVYVGGTLEAESTGTVKIPNNGRVGVVKGGALSVKNPLSVNNGAGATVLGTAKVGVGSDGLLVWAGLTTVAEINAAFTTYSQYGGATLGVKTTLPPSDIAGVTVPAGRKLAATATAAVQYTADATLTVPANVAITTTGKVTVDSDKTLTVSGTGALTVAGAVDIKGSVVVSGGTSYTATADVTGSQA